MGQTRIAHTRNLMIKRSQRKEIVKGAVFMVLMLALISIAFAYGVGSAHSDTGGFFSCIPKPGNAFSCLLG